MIAALPAWWAHRQALDGSMAGRPAAEVLARTGWARSVGGAGPYLTLFARAAVTRAAAEAALADGAILELPAARGCTYVVPAAEFALALAAGRGFGWERDFATAAKLGVTAKELDRLCEAVLGALAGGELEPDEIRAAVGAAARNLGEAGKKKGLTTTLPVALARLQSEGEIRRVPTNGRLDTQRYRYALWRPNPLARFACSAEEIHAELARRYFRWIGPARPAEFQAFAGLGVKAAKAALEPLGLVPLQGGEGRVMFADDADALRAFTAPKQPQVVLVGSVDGLALLRRDVGSLVAPEHRETEVLAERDHEPAGRLTDLPSHGIFDRGRLVGLWEYDVDSSTIAWRVFGGRTPEIAAAVSRTEAFVRDQLGDARSFSLDSPKSRAPRIAALRAAGPA